MAELTALTLTPEEVDTRATRAIDEYATRTVRLDRVPIGELTALPLTLGCATVVCP